MKTKIITIAYLALFALCYFRANAQVVTKDVLAKYKNWPRFREISKFYELSQEQTVWIRDSLLQKQLKELIKRSASIGLDEQDYQNDFLAKSIVDSIQTDVFFTDAAIHLFMDVKNGRQPPSFTYAGLNYKVDNSSLLVQLHQKLQEGNINELFLQVQPRSKEYEMALEKLRWFEKITEDPGFKDAKISSTIVTGSNQPLVKRLYQLGFLDSTEKGLTKNQLVAKLRLAQEEFDLLNDGILRSTTLQTLNVSLLQRVDELKYVLNTFRWLEGVRQNNPVLILNIPSANLFVYEEGQIVMDSRVIVGKESTPTPTLTSTITEVILYPYWTVPYKIATQELLPQIKSNVAFLNWGNYQVLNKSGKVLNPHKINWRSLSGSYFPYILRQSTGCDNSLGLVKFNFYNPFTVYLHDTPFKMLFLSTRRFYSHGCMRVENPGELAHYLLGNNRIAFDTLTAKGCLKMQSPVIVQTEKKLPVIILYSTVWYNKEGQLRFYNDVYDRLKF